MTHLKLLLPMIGVASIYFGGRVADVGAVAILVIAAVLLAAWIGRRTSPRQPPPDPSG